MAEGYQIKDVRTVSHRTLMRVDTVDSIASHTNTGSTGEALSDAGASGNPWSIPISGNTDAGTFGELIGKKLLTLAKWIGLR